MSGEPLLIVDRLAAGYGRIRVLNGVSLTVPEGGFVTIVGANGAGKTTLLKTLMGLVHAVEGSVTFKGHPLLHKAAHQRVELGIAYVPEGRHVFPSLTVHENLELTAVRRSGGGAGDAIERIYELFPRLRERRTQRAKTLSGGEQQMLALGRALVLDPVMLIADEISLGLAPIVVERMFEVLAQMHAQGKTILLAEQNARLALEAAEDAYVLEAGSISIAGKARDLCSDPRIVEAYLQSL